NQREFARQAGVSPSHISRLESGCANPSVRRLHAMLQPAGARLSLRAVTDETNGTGGMTMSRGTTFDDLIDELVGDPAEREMEDSWRPSRGVATLLMKLRADRGLSQRQLATLAGVTPAYISQLESGTANPSVRRLDAILRSVGARLVLLAAPDEAPRASGKRRAS
ncbi:MAG: helix-turn-helix domain-containing protein, partial [Tepidiformaceae bacterium]